MKCGEKDKYTQRGPAFVLLNRWIKYIEGRGTPYACIECVKCTCEETLWTRPALIKGRIPGVIGIALSYGIQFHSGAHLIEIRDIRNGHVLYMWYMGHL